MWAAASGCCSLTALDPGFRKMRWDGLVNWAEMGWKWRDPEGVTPCSTVGPICSIVPWNAFSTVPVSRSSFPKISVCLSRCCTENHDITRGSAGSLVWIIGSVIFSLSPIGFTLLVKTYNLCKSDGWSRWCMMQIILSVKTPWIYHQQTVLLGPITTVPNR